MGKRARGGIVAERDGMRVELLEGEDEERDVVAVSLGTLNREFGQTDAPCWACDYNFGPPEDPKANPAMHELWTFWLMGRSHMHELKFAAQMADMHEECMRGPLLKQGEECIEWPADTVLRHLHHHIVDPAFELENDVKHMRDIMTSLEDSLFEQDKVSGTVKPRRDANLNQLKVYLVAWETKQTAVRNLLTHT